MKVRFAPSALADLEEIRDYLIPLSPRGAEHVRSEIVAAIDRIAEFPRTGNTTDEADLYRYALRKHH
jgi:plasmid stabilization system protein ParE